MTEGFTRVGSSGLLVPASYASAYDAHVAGGDPYFANVVSMSLYEGPTIQDLVSGVNWTVTGDGAIVSTDPLYTGTKHLSMDGNSDRLDSNALSSLAMGTGPFTWEIAFKRPAGYATGQVNLLSYTNSSLVLYYSGSTTLRMFAAGADRITGGTLSASNYNIIAYDRDSLGVGRLYLNRTQIGSNYSDSNNYTANVLRIDSQTVGASSTHVYAYHRITKGVNRYGGASYADPGRHFPTF